MCMFWVYDRFIEDIDNKKIVNPPIDYAADKLYNIPDSVNNFCNRVHGILLFKNLGHTLVKKFLRLNFSNLNVLFSYFYICYK